MKNIFRSQIAVALLLLLVPAAACRAHGTSCRVIGRVLAVEASYDEGRPMAYCDVIVYLSDAEDSVFTTGETDEKGRYSFFPESDGEFRVVVDDGMGHATSIQVGVWNGAVSVKGSEDKDTVSGIDQTGTCIFKRIGRGAGILVGVSLIFGLFGLVSVLRPAGLTGRKKGS